MLTFAKIFAYRHKKFSQKCETNIFVSTLTVVRLGEPFEEQTTDGRKCKTTVTMDGNKLITDQKATKEGEKDVKAVRPFFRKTGIELGRYRCKKRLAVSPSPAGMSLTPNSPWPGNSLMISDQREFG